MGYLRLGDVSLFFSDYCTASLYTNVRGCEGLCGTAAHRLAVRGGGIAEHRKAVGGGDTARHEGAVKGRWHSQGAMKGRWHSQGAVKGRWHSQGVR